MKLVYHPEDAYAQLDFARREGKRIGLVPTMGALHQGHLSLVRHAKERSDLVVATIFVNPSQFGPKEDFSKYPRSLEADLKLLEQVNCDYVFVPSAEQMYPLGFSTYVDPPAVARLWEGNFRPHHFRGVATVVLKLFLMVPAQAAYFGRKDYQQVAVISAMVRDLNVPIGIVACDTVRESDGLAMSSRNRYLSEEERQRATGLYRALQTAQRMLDDGHDRVAAIEFAMQQVLMDAKMDAIDYAAVVHPDTMEPLERIEEEAVAILAARVGTTRLIDNLVLRAR